jgi:histidinol dehydrogenase
VNVRLAAPSVLLQRHALHELTPARRASLLDRAPVAGRNIRSSVRGIIDEVRRGGDDAVRAANARFGGGLPRTRGKAPLTVAPLVMRAALGELSPALRSALETMIANIERFHSAQVPEREDWVDVAPGIRVGRSWRPIDSVAAYIPGGEAAYPSSLLMTAVPARLAGVGRLAVASPAGRDGTLSPALLGAAALLGIEEFYVMGGAQAVAALAYGTETVRAVDKIVGPGNSWVTAAKLEVFGVVGIDLPAGPSEVMVLADASADPAHVAADLLSQAEHGPDSAAVLVTTSPDLVDAVEVELTRQLAGQARHEFLRRALASAGLALEASHLDEALDFVNDYAPEHLSILVAEPAQVVERVRNAGSIFLGAFSPESAGDYATGSNHVLPTGRLARAYGPLSVESFGRYLQVQELTREGLRSLRTTVGAIAEAEGLTAHRRAVEIRFADERSARSSRARSGAGRSTQGEGEGGASRGPRRITGGGGRSDGR